MLTVIITTFKEPETLAKQLKILISELSSIPKPWEIIVAAPDPKTQRVVLDYHDSHSFIKLIKDRGVGKPAALNLALKGAKGDILILTDGDVRIVRGSILEILKLFKDQNVGAVSGRPLSANPRQKMLGYWSHLLSDLAHKIRTERDKRGEYIDCSGYLYAIRSHIIDKIPNYTLSDDGLISQLISRQGYAIAYAPQARVLVKYPETLSDWLAQKKRSTGGYIQIPEILARIYNVNSGAKMRSFAKEASGIFQAFKYARDIKEFWWTMTLIFARIYLWCLIFWEIKIKKIPFARMWQRVESTK